MGIFYLFRACHLNLDPTFKYELDPYSLEIYRMCRYEILTARFSKLSSDGQTDRQTDTTELYTTPLSRVVNKTYCI